MEDITEKLQTLIEFYPKHIEKEDKVFLPSSRKYFSEEDDQAMLTEFWEFDRNMIHEKYIIVVEGCEKNS
jgi:hemerythrin-like domain-containing protein